MLWPDDLNVPNSGSKSGEKVGHNFSVEATFIYKLVRIPRYMSNLLFISEI